MLDHGRVGSGDRAGTEPRHGGGVLAAARAYPGAPRPWIDLSTGINPHAYPAPDLPVEAWTRLPEPEQIAELERAAAECYGAAPCGTVAAPGTSVLIAVLARLFRGPAAILGSTYGEYAASWPGAVIAHDLSGAFMSRPVRIVCQPDNPTGAVHDPAELARSAAGGLLIVDESYADFVPGSSVAPLLREGSGLIVLRSFGKAYGLAGLRLGFALADRAGAALIREALGPWPVSGPAVRIGAAALADSGWRGRMQNRLGDERTRLDGLLRHAGFRHLSGTPLFVLAHSGAPGWFAHLASSGILVRAFADRPGAIRFGLPPAAGCWDRLASALETGPR